MKEKVFRIGCTWEYNQHLNETGNNEIVPSEDFDDEAYVPITDRVTMQVCVIRKGEKYGIYSLDHTHGFGGPGVWCSPTVKPFPYDEVKCCTFFGDEEYGLFAFRIENKWGILKVVDGDEPSEGLYDVELYLTKRRIVVPCEYASVAEAEQLLGGHFNWEDPFAQMESEG